MRTHRRIVPGVEPCETKCLAARLLGGFVPHIDAGLPDRGTHIGLTYDGPTEVGAELLDLLAVNANVDRGEISLRSGHHADGGSRSTPRTRGTRSCDCPAFGSPCVGS